MVVLSGVCTATCENSLGQSSQICSSRVVFIFHPCVHTVIVSGILVHTF